MNQKTIKKYASLAFNKYREKYGLFLAEGQHLIDQLMKSDWETECILISNNRTFEKLKSENKIPDIELVKPDVIGKIATTRTPQEILAVVRIPDVSRRGLTRYNRILIADGIRDPGNMGTMIRTARAFGFDAVITTTKSVDIFNPKVVRATQGAIFGIKLIFDIKADDIIDTLKPTHSFYALDPGGDIDIDDSEPDHRLVLMIGSEIEGISRSLFKLADFKIRISHSNSVDSLNAAVAAGIAMHRFSGI